jgi:hypothetical protein
VREVKKMTPVMVHTNAGPFTVQEKTKLPWCDMEVWFDPNAVTNVLSFVILQEKFLIIYDNSKADAFIIKTPKGDLEFKLLSKNPVCSQANKQWNQVRSEPRNKYVEYLGRKQDFLHQQTGGESEESKSTGVSIRCRSEK